MPQLVCRSYRVVRSLWLALAKSTLYDNDFSVRVVGPGYLGLEGPFSTSQGQPCFSVEALTQRRVILGEGKPDLPCRPVVTGLGPSEKDLQS